MGLRSGSMRIFRTIFREQKTRLQVDWLTHTDELIMEHLHDESPQSPTEIATAIGRSVEYVADRCRQLALRELLDEEGGQRNRDRNYSLASHGLQYLRGELSAEELEDLGSTKSDKNT